MERRTGDETTSTELRAFSEKAFNAYRSEGCQRRERKAMPTYSSIPYGTSRLQDTDPYDISPEPERHAAIDKVLASDFERAFMSVGPDLGMSGADIGNPPAVNTTSHRPELYSMSATTGATGADAESKLVRDLRGIAYDALHYRNISPVDTTVYSCKLEYILRRNGRFQTTCTVFVFLLMLLVAFLH